MLEELKQLVYEMNLLLPRSGLVTWTSGNVSGRDPQTGLVAIKPSGVRYERLTADDIVLVDLDGRQVAGHLRPSVDTATHLYVYRHRPDVGGVVHTHSPYATAFAAVGRPIEPCLTALADEFGCTIPLGAYAPIGGEEIGREIVRSIGPAPAILMRHHGVFALGPDPEAAVKAAVMVEDAARTLWIAMQIGDPQSLPPEEVDRLHRAYTEGYGQR
ncbi:MAG: L-ribulose-5-phosphate 4-epimerase [Anaerolineae bacterium]|nr:L-ribulose-5-phosphate 4-epimerase [Anaerolineae bacterium]